MIANTSEITPQGNQMIDESEEHYSKGTRDSYFAYAVRNDWQGIAYLLLKNDYNLMEAIKDALNEERFKYVIALMNKVRDDSIFKKVDEKLQNLFHIFAIKGTKAPHDLTLQIFNKFTQKGIDFKGPDQEGKTPLHYAAEKNFLFL
mmetsp:Transcript_3384/g.2936  ORF Transcript_3384/g.2936 Transcript_3384/m.2936 type:complete len:146 (+) Transcript_3384:546-983(+)